MTQKCWRAERFWKLEGLLACSVHSFLLTAPNLLVSRGTVVPVISAPAWGPGVCTGECHGVPAPLPDSRSQVVCLLQLKEEWPACYFEIGSKGIV